MTNIITCRSTQPIVSKCLWWSPFPLRPSVFLSSLSVILTWCLSDERWGRGLKCRDFRVFNNKVQQMNNKNYPEGEKQAGRQKTGANIKQSNTGNSHDVRQRISTGLQTQGDYIGRQTRVTSETQLEPLKQ